jgi:hypothetical protein
MLPGSTNSNSVCVNARHESARDSVCNSETWRVPSTRIGQGMKGSRHLTCSGASSHQLNGRGADCSSVPRSEGLLLGSSSDARLRGASKRGKLSNGPGFVTRPNLGGGWWREEEEELVCAHPIPPSHPFILIPPTNPYRRPFPQWGFDEPRYKLRSLSSA